MDTRKERGEVENTAVEPLKIMTKEKLEPLEQNRVKELIAVHDNIAGNSGRAGLHTRTSGRKEESKLWSR